MKRMMIATALATTLGTAGFAATEAQMQQVDSFSDGVDTSTFTERDYDIGYSIITSGMSTSEKAAKLRALATDDNVDTGMVMISEAEMARLEQYAPETDFGTITQAQAESALAITYSGASESTKMEQVQNILTGGDMDDMVLASIGEGQLNVLTKYVSEEDLAGLSQDELQLALSFAYSGMSETEKAQQIEALTN